MSITVENFIEVWQNANRTERSAAQEHFLALCDLLGEKKPAECDPDGNFFTFEKGVNKTTGGSGWADVWLKGCFAWEYKSKGKDLVKAFTQLQQYALALENPPLLIVSDMDIIEIHTNFTNTINKVHVISLKDLRIPANLQKLKAIFDVNQIELLFKPQETRESVTLKMAASFTELAQRLRERGHEPYQVAHFINRLVFCMFAEDIGILPKNLLSSLLKSIIEYIAEEGKNYFVQRMSELFSAMHKGGYFGIYGIQWFNGGLFDNADCLPLEKQDIKDLFQATKQNWKDIEPSIFGTLFERGLDPDKRSQLGAHYTDRDSILRILQPVIFQPLQEDWQIVKQQMSDLLAQPQKTEKKQKEAKDTAQALVSAFLEKLRAVRVLDPACGSGNFLYLTLLGLKDLEYQILTDAELLGLGKQYPQISPKVLSGIEINPYAAELARVTMWIGQIQWMLGHGYGLNKKPILESLDNIECCDALIHVDGSEKTWQQADFIVGNPPFLGGLKLLSVLDENYVGTLRNVFKERVPASADLVCYWFEKARAQLEQGKVQAVGLVSTNSIRGGSNRKVLDKIAETGQIFHAWSDEPWVNEGAAVRVSLVCFAGKNAKNYAVTLLDNQVVSEIYSDLTAPNTTQTLDLTKAKPLAENANTAFIGTQKNGAFDIAGDLAREWVKSSFNPNGKPNSDVLRPWANGMDIVRRYSDTWIIDFGVNMSEDDASLYEKPFEHVVKNVKPQRIDLRMKKRRECWWLHGASAGEMRNAIKPLSRFIISPRVSKYRLFTWMHTAILADSATVAIARDDDTTFGILHSRFHELWSLRLCTWLGKGNDPRYTPSTTFETFPFPEGLTPNIPASDYADNPHAQAIATATKRLNELRDNWLNPQELIKREPEIIAGYPDRILPINAEAEKELKKRTLTNLYNQKPQWLIKAHENLDKAVATAYGWQTDLKDDEILEKLLALNLERSAK